MGLRRFLRNRLDGRDLAPPRSVHAAYVGLLGRAPTSEELSATVARLRAGTLSLEGLLAELAPPRASRAGGPWPSVSHLTAADPLPDQSTAIRAQARPFVDMTYLSEAEFDQAWQEVLGGNTDLVIGQRDYLRVHRRRFRELFNAVLALTGQAPHILEIGTSEASRFYRYFRPEASVVTADRPVADDYIGFTPEKSRRIAGAHTHVAIDLERDDPGSHAELVAAGPFDLIVFTEVLEHLVTPPAPLIAGLLGQLVPGGALYLTTPNFLSAANRAQIATGRNPQPVYPGAAANWDRHHHFREYTMRELLEMVDAAGGDLETAYYSACWDTDPANDQSGAGDSLPDDQRANLVAIARPKHGATR